MSKRSLSLLLVFVVGGFTLAAARAVEPPVNSAGARLATYDSPSGETFFALCLAPNVRPKPVEIQDVVILVDTSASQAGLYRDDTLLAVSSMVRRLDANDRVHLMAVDTAAVALTEAFVPVDSPQLKKALQRLKDRSPLGATDMTAALTAALASFQDATGHPRSVVYVGDGVSRAGLLGRQQMKQLIEQLVAKHIAVSSYAIGPERNIELLAVLANHTGGMVFVDTDAEAAAQTAGRGLARAVQQTVFWPESVVVPDCLVEVYPKVVPPLRSDRDSVLIGKLEVNGTPSIAMKVVANGTAVNLQWNLVPEPSKDEFAFLTALVDMARDDDGLSLPTVGSAGLREAARVLQAGSNDLSRIGQLPRAIERPVTNVVHFVSYQEEKANTKASTGGGDGLLSELEGKLLDEVQEQRSVRTQKMQVEVENALDDARKRMGTDAAGAIQNLKVQLDTVQRDPDLDAEVRAQLQDRIRTTMREASRRKLENDELTRQAEANRAIAEEADRVVREITDKHDQVKQLMERFDAVLDEALSLAFERESIKSGELFQEADTKIATPVRLLLPHNPIGMSARWNSRFLRHVTGQIRFTDLRSRNLADALYTVEESAIPFPDEPPIQYPDPETWEKLSENRKKYKSMDLLGSGTKEKEIYDALSVETRMEFDETPLSEVVDYLQTSHSIPIIIDKRALDEVGLTSDTPVTMHLAGITLRSALRLMLKELELTYVIKDEVLRITTPEAAEEELITKVYPVGDLVMPIINMGGGMGMGMGGGMGGMGMGGGMGGMGMGGGMGGMGMGGGMGGMGGGMGGGMFAVDDQLSLGVKKPAASSKTVKQPKATQPTKASVASVPSSSVKPLTVAASDGQTLDTAWDALFTQHRQDNDVERGVLQRRVQVTAKALSADMKYAEIIVMIQSALRNRQAQPWMYEALALALRATDAPKSEVARALLSLVDFSDDADEVMRVASYMARIGLDKPALGLFRDVAFTHPFRPEPYALGLSCAERLDDIDGIQWACLGVLSQAWPTEQSGIQERADRSAKATLNRLRNAKQTEQADRFERLLDEARRRDVTATVRWTGDADVDLVVQEPTGTVCSAQNPRTIAGGVLLGDSYAHGASTEGFSETYVCPKGFNGEYRMLVRRIWGDVTAGTVTIDIHTHNPDRPHIHKQIPLSDKDALVLFGVTQGRRIEQVAKQYLANLNPEQVASDRAMLNRQLSRYEDSLEHRHFDRDRQVQRRRGFSGGRPGGSRPLITTLPEGTMLLATAIVSADRRYVRTSPSPMFSFIGQVNTFNYNTGETTTLPGNGDTTDNNNNNGNNNNNNN